MEIALSLIFVLVIAGLIIGLTVRKFFRTSEIQTTEIEGAGGPIIHSDVDKQEFSRVFAGVLLDEKARKVLIPLLTESGNNITSREMTFFKYMNGEESREDVLRMMESRRQTDSRSEAEILLKQIKIISDEYQESSQRQN